MTKPEAHSAVGDLVAFLEGHEALEDQWSDLVGLPCFHFSRLIENIDRGDASLQSAGDGDGRNKGVPRLLTQAGLPTFWVEVYLATEAGDFGPSTHWLYLRALYAELSGRLENQSESARSALALASLVEAILMIEVDLMAANDRYNYIPRWDLWWSRYMSIVDARLTPQDLKELTFLAGRYSYTECMSQVTQPERLEEIYRRSGGYVDNGVAGNPNLPTALVDEVVLDNPELIFHPSITPSRAWSALLALLEDEGVEELVLSHLRNFENFRDDSWSKYADLPSRSPHMHYLYQQVLEWGQGHDFQEWLEDLEFAFFNRGQSR